MLPQQHGQEPQLDLHAAADRLRRGRAADEMAIRKGHDYRIIVSDLDRRLPIWVGGTGCTEADRDLIFAALGRWKSL
jgi:transposase